MTTNDEKQPTPGRGSDADASQYWRAVRPYIWLVVLITIGATVAAYMVTARLPRVYEAACSLEYDPNPARPLGDGVEDVTEQGTSFWATREFYETQNRIIASRLIAERVVRQLGLNEDRGFPDASGDLPESWDGMTVEAAAVILQGRITVTPIPETRLVQVRVRDRVPERAALIANAIVDAYIEKTIEDRLGATVSALEWLGEQLDNLRDELHGSELALHEFWQEHDILSVSMEDRQNLVAGELEQFSNALTAARTRRIELRARVARLRTFATSSEADDVGAGFADYPAIQTLQTELRTTLAERESMSTRYGPEHPQMVELDRQIAALREQLQAEIASVISAAEAELVEAAQIESGLRSAVDDANSAGLALNLLEIEYSRLERERENNAHLYELVLTRTAETDLTRMLRTTHVRTVDRALPPGGPISPRLPVNLAIGAGAGLVLGLGLALALARFDRRIKTFRQVEELGLTILGVLPAIDDKITTAYASKRPRSGDRRRSRAKDGAGIEPQAASRDVIVHTHPMSSAAEHIRALRTNIMFMAADHKIRSLAVTSGSPREGKTTVVTNLAITIAQSGKRVLIVDTDMRRPRVHQALGIKGRVGLTNILVGDSALDDTAQETSIPGVWVLPCGPIPPNPSELLHGERFRQFVRDAEAAFDFVLYDSPPVGPVTDAAVLGPQLDGMLLVVRAQQTTTDSVASMLRQLRDVGANVIGGVINGFDPSLGRYEDGGYYYYYRREGYYASNDDGDDDPKAGGGAPGSDEPPRSGADVN
jgi:succinoglycan biosynthesis transport protein ExoP